MTTTYLDTSAAVKLAVEEPKTAALRGALTLASGRALVASWLLHTELHCAVGRRPSAFSLRAVDSVLERVALVDLTRADLLTAGTFIPLRSQDAIHLAVALRVGADEIMTYDAELAEAAERAGLRVVAPGA